MQTIQLENFLYDPVTTALTSVAVGTYLNGHYNPSKEIQWFAGLGPEFMPSGGELSCDACLY